jgi:predicted nucleic acid-binding protein
MANGRWAFVLKRSQGASFGAWSIMRDLARAGLAGGIARDPYVAACALETGATEFATSNRRDFARLDHGWKARTGP